MSKAKLNILYLVIGLTIVSICLSPTTFFMAVSLLVIYGCTAITYFIRYIYYSILLIFLKDKL